VIDINRVDRRPRHLWCPQGG